MSKHVPIDSILLIIQNMSIRTKLFENKSTHKCDVTQEHIKLISHALKVHGAYIESRIGAISTNRLKNFCFTYHIKHYIDVFQLLEDYYHLVTADTFTFNDFLDGGKFYYGGSEGSDQFYKKLTEYVVYKRRDKDLLEALDNSESMLREALEEKDVKPYPDAKRKRVES